MSDPEPRPPPSDNGNGALSQVTDTAVSVVKRLTLQNVLTLAILAAVTIPAFFAWRFLSDTDFRHEFMSTAHVIDMRVPCMVVTGNVTGMDDKWVVFIGYQSRERLDYLIGIRVPGETPTMNTAATICEKVHADANLLRAAIADRDAQATRGK